MRPLARFDSKLWRIEHKQSRRSIRSRFYAASSENTSSRRLNTVQDAANFNELLDLSTLRSRLLAQAQYREAVQLYCYAMARANRLLELPPQLWQGPFPAQVAFDSLFDLCLVVDSVIHEKHAADWKFIALAEELSRTARLGLTRSQLKEINGLFQHDFAQTLSSGLSGELTLQGGARLSPLATSLAITYGCRNRGAHSVAAVPVTPSEYDALVDHVCSVLFLAVETMYP